MSKSIPYEELELRRALKDIPSYVKEKEIIYKKKKKIAKKFDKVIKQIEREQKKLK